MLYLPISMEYLSHQEQPIPCSPLFGSMVCSFGPILNKVNVVFTTCSLERNEPVTGELFSRAAALGNVPRIQAILNTPAA